MCDYKIDYFDLKARELKGYKCPHRSVKKLEEDGKKFCIFHSEMEERGYQYVPRNLKSLSVVYYPVNEKRPNKLYIYGECTGSLTVTLTGDEGTVKGPYTAKFLKNKGQQRRRVPLGYKLKFTYGSFKFSNVKGCDFSVDTVIVKTADLRHGVK